VTIGVHGDWGAGKSRVLKMTSAALERDKDAVSVVLGSVSELGYDRIKDCGYQSLDRFAYSRHSQLVV
jgi:ABC-type Na+ transport system ATPase subunit NatA